jgi:hypothetical protein
MSFSFYLDLPKPPPLGGLLEPIPYDILCVEEEEIDPADDWPEGYTHLFREHLSTCAVEIKRVTSRFQVRIMDFAAPEDYELALGVVEQLAKWGQVETIEPEDLEPMPLAALQKRYGNQWIAEQVQSLFGMLPGMVAKEKDASLQVPGPVRPFWIGPRLLKELMEAGPEKSLPERIIAAIRKVQYVDPEEYFCAAVMEVSSKTTDESFTVTAWGPGVRYLFPNVEYLAVIEDMEGEEHFLVPYKAIHEIAGDYCSWLDEEQTVVEPFDDDEWPKVLERARKHEVDPGKAGGRLE